MPKILKQVVPIAAVIAAVIGWKMYNKGQASKEVRPLAVSLVQTFPGYEINKAYFDSALDELHNKAFDQSYKMGGRRTGASFNEERYVTLLLGLYQRKAAQDGKNDVSASLEELRKTLGLAVVEIQ